MRVPCIIERTCCCKSSGQALCAVHWLKRLRDQRPNSRKVFSLSCHLFLSRIRDFAARCDIAVASNIGTHAFRRGMAQDIVSAAGSLAMLLKAGGWHSKAFLTYLRDSQIRDEAIAQLVINVSDSEDESRET